MPMPPNCLHLLPIGPSSLTVVTTFRGHGDGLGKYFHGDSKCGSKRGALFANLLGKKRIPLWGFVQPRLRAVLEIARARTLVAWSQTARRRSQALRHQAHAQLSATKLMAAMLRRKRNRKPGTSGRLLSMPQRANDGTGKRSRVA